MFEPIRPQDRRLHKVDELIVRREMRFGSRILEPGNKIYWRDEKCSWRDIVVLWEQGLVDTLQPDSSFIICPECTEYFNTEICSCCLATEVATTEVATTEVATTEVATTELSPGKAKRTKK